MQTDLSTKEIHEIRTDGIDLTDGLKVDGIGKLEELKNLHIKKMY